VAESTLLQKANEGDSMRLITLLLGSTMLSGCVGTRVVEIDPANESERYTLVEAAQAQSGEIVTDGDVIRFKKNQLQVTRGTLRVDPRGRRSKGQISVPLNDGPVEVRFRYRGSPLGAVIGVVAGGIAGYAMGYSSGEGSGSCCTRKENAVIGAGILGVVGAIIGAVFGPKKTTAYRFLPDTPQQMSVVIGVGPRITQNGGAR
jgi:hypothetical protein